MHPCPPVSQCQTQVITTVASMAAMLEDEFTPYFQPFMEYARVVLALPPAKQYSLLRGKTMECVGLMCSTLPLELSRGYVVPLIEQMIKLQVRHSHTRLRYCRARTSWTTRLNGVDVESAVRLLLETVLTALHGSK